MLPDWAVWMIGLGLGLGIGYTLPHTRRTQVLAHKTAPPQPVPRDGTVPAEVWEKFAECTMMVLPILSEHIRQVIHRTEQDAVEVGHCFQNLRQRWSPRTEGSFSSDESHIVTALQRQDAVRQQLEHVTQTLVDVQALLTRLQAGDPLEDLVSPRELVERLHSSYTMPEERAVMAAVLDGHTMPPSVDDPAVQKDNVTLF